MVEQRAVVRLVRNANYVRLGPDDGVAQASNASFDAATFEVWGALLNGARLVVLQKATLMDAQSLAEAIASQRITTLFLTTALFNRLSHASPPPFAALTHLLFGGERADPGSVLRVLEHGAPRRLIHVYGPTETTTFATWYSVTEGNELRNHVPIGGPISNATAYIVNRDGQPQPIGVVGELLIGGDGVARGYLRRPELTAERFASDPFCADSTARLYRTGDFARYRPDGNIEFIGRRDQQVKIRGFRIEPGEIEAVLASHPEVAGCAVVVDEDSSGECALVAYYAATEGADLSREAARGFLSSKLPDYMVPAVFVALPSLPLTSNGKVDRKRLPEPQRESAVTDDQFAAPRNPIEEQVAAVWADVLGLERAGVHQNFFESGGHSLLAMQLVSRLRAVFDVQIPLQTIFADPTIAKLAGHIAGLLGQAKKDASLSVREPGDVERTALSFAQRRLWLLDQLLPSGSVYNVPRVVRLVGALDVEALRRAFAELVSRHEALRTRFEMRDGEPVQVIEPQLSLALEPEDLSALVPAQREAEAERRAQQEAQASFDLERGPLIRVRLLRLTPSEHWLLLSLHHIVTDGWSMGVLFNELSALYGAYCQGEASPLAELPVQYADYALWQREWLQREVLEQQLTYWRQALADLPVLELPTDRSRPMAASYRGARVSFELGEALTRGLKELGRREGATLFMTLLAAFQVLLYRYSGQEDLAVGVPVAGRSRPELEGLIGFFVNTLVLRADLSGAPSFEEHLARVRARALEAYAHQDLPFEKLVEALAPRRDLSRNPLFQASLVLQNTPPGELKLEGLDVQRLEGLGSESAKFDLDFELTENPGRLSGSIQYATDLFDAATIERMVGHWRVLLEAIVADPGQAISKLPLLTEAERHQLLVEWNDTAVEYPRDRCIHQLFEAQVERSPEATALVYETQQLTYGELNARANRLAHHLRSLGVGPEVLVGVCLERSLELVVGLLAILKAGGAYVPLDPSYPAERLAFMLQDTQAPVLLTEQRSLAKLPAYAGHTLCLDRDTARIAQHPETNPPTSSRPTNLAYVIYTSGSTGKPKGVMVTHGNVVRLFSATQPWYAFDERDVWTCFHSYAFDFSVWEIWGAMAYGSRLVMVPYLVSRDPDAFHALLRRERVTVLNQTPSAFRQLIAADSRAGTASDLTLRLVIFGGEALEMQALRPWFDRHGDLKPRLVNMYGITETTVHVTYRPIRRTDLDATRGSMIGEPIPGLCVYLLDRYRQPVPIGVPGEIVVGGAGVSRGYLNRPDLTAERFIPNPFADDCASRLYRSGDLARRTSSGDLEYLGRIDEQVKIRGFRIEPSEVSVELGAHPGVRECHVMARRQASGDIGLTAYLVPNDAYGGDLTPPQLRGYLATRLPEYMIPVSFVTLASFPLTPTEKWIAPDLPEPREAPEFVEFQSSAKGSAGAPPREALGANARGRRHRNSRRLLRARRAFSTRGTAVRRDRATVRTPATAGHPLVQRCVDRRRRPPAARGGAIDHLADSSCRSSLPGSKPPLFVVHTIGGNLFHYDHFARALDPDQPVMGLQARGVYGREQPRHRIEDIAADCVGALRSHQAQGPYLIAGYSSAGIVAFEIARQLESAGEQVGLLALIDSFSPRAKRKRSLAQATAGMLRRVQLRLVQERAYHAILHWTGLSHRRRLGSVGEAQRWAYWSYRAQHYAGAACLFVANASLETVHEPTLGWEQLVQGGLHVHRLPGGHSSIMKAPLLAELAATLQSELDRATGALRRGTASRGLLTEPGHACAIGS